MFHRLTAGYFDSAAISSSRTLVVLRPIDLDIVRRLVDEFSFVGDGHVFQIDGEIMTIHDGYVDCPWLTPCANRRAVEFMLRLRELTECMFVDINHGEVVDRQQLLESLGVI